MHVYTDIRCLQDPNYSFRGVGHHSATLLRSRKDYLDESRLIGVFDPNLPPVPEAYADIFDELLSWPKATFARQQSIFLQMSPMTHDQAVCGRILDRKAIFTSSVVYDFIPLDVPERYLAHPNSLHTYASSMLWLEAYDHYAPISEYSERRLLELLPVDPSRSCVTGVTLRPAFETILRNRLSGTEDKPIRSRPTRNNYFIFVGGGDPRKNLDVILPAHSSLVNSGFSSDLVIVGNYQDNYREAIRKHYEAMGGNVAKLIFEHGVSDLELADWYHEALATICSSHIEGFSLPVIEGIACGSPVLASDCEAHRELITDSATRFPSTDDVALRGLMFRVLTEAGYRKQLIDQQRDVPTRFYKDKVAAKFWEPILAGYRKRFGCSSTHYHTAYSLPSLAILSPYPPDRSGVADYTKRTVEALAGQASVDVFTDVSTPAATNGVNAFHPINDWAYISDRYDRVLTVIGNSHFHTKIIDLQRAYGGPCLIHDNRLAELYNWWKGPEYFRTLACKSFKREVSHEEAQSWIADPGFYPVSFSMNSSIVPIR